MLELAPASYDFPNELPKYGVGWNDEINEPIVRTAIDGKRYELPEHIVYKLQNLYQIVNDYTERLKRFEAQRDKYLYDYYDANDKFKSLRKHTKDFIDGLLVDYSRDRYYTKQDIINEINQWYNYTKEVYDF